MTSEGYALKEFNLRFGVNLTIYRDLGIVTEFGELPYTVKYTRWDDGNTSLVLTEMEFDLLVERMKRELCEAGIIRKENINNQRRTENDEHL